LCSLVSDTLPNLSFKEKIRRLWKHYVFSEIKATIIKIINLNTNIFFPYLYSKKYIKKTCVWATDNWSPGYYHWIAEALPRILISENLLKNYTLLLPATLKNNDFVIKSLDCFNIKNIEYININEKVFAKELILPTHLSYSGYHNKKIINKLRKKYRDYYSNYIDNKKEDRIYISRSKAKKRKVINENEIKPILKKYGFKIINFEDCDWKKQLKICLNTKYLIGIHGAGLANMLFMKKSSYILELRYGMHYVQCYLRMASALDLNYLYQKCNLEKLNQKFSNGNIIVDPKILEKNINFMIKHKNE
jgi:capsular polysaccharide biosynthesis protein